MEVKRKRALLVGVNKYSARKILNLNFCVNDATSMHRTLIDPERGGFDPNSCLLMTDNSKEARLTPIRSNLMSSIKSLSKMAKSDDYLLFFFSGHGMEEERKTYLLPPDARINVLGDTAIPIDWIKETMKKSKARVKVMILDACHSGAIKGKAESGRMTKALHDSIFPAPKGSAILTSCQMNEVSYELPNKKSSVFTFFLNEGLEGAADFDNNGRILIPDASRYATEKTLEWASNEGVEQSPTLDYRVVRDLVLVHVPLRKTDLEVGEAPEEIFDLTRFIWSIRLHTGTRFSINKKENKKWERRVGAFLLRYYDPELIKKAKGIWRFPDGSFNSDYRYIEFTWGKSHNEFANQIIHSYLTSREKGRALSILLKKGVGFDARRFVKLEDKGLLHDVYYHSDFRMITCELTEKYDKKIGKNIRVTLHLKPSGEEPSMSLAVEKGMIGGATFKKLEPNKLFKYLGNIFKFVEKTRNVQE